VTHGDLQDAFRERGFAGPIRVFTPKECRAILTGLRGKQERPPLDWHKGRAVTSLYYYSLATHDRILDLVTSVLGNDIILWGASLLGRAPGYTHPWHSDMESSAPKGETVAVWIGLACTNSQSSLTVAPYSHRFGVTVQQLMQENGRGPHSIGDAEVARWAQERDSRSDTLRVGTLDGEALLFDGRLWHGSHNLNRRGKRYAALLQYATPRTPIRIPRFTQRRWPFESHDTPRPPCIIVSGSDVDAVNRLVPPPVAGDRGGRPALSTRIHRLRLPLDQDPAVGWKPHPLFRGATPGIKSIACHVSVLDPDRQPHTPHRHDEEEILMVLDGEADLVVDDGSGSGGVVRHHVQARTFAYYPAGFAHTIHNASDAPVTYLMFKWATDHRDDAKCLDHLVVSPPDCDSAVRPDAKSAFVRTRLLHGETKYLRRLHSHISSLQPGAGYAPHVDAYDVAIVVLEGTVETLGKRVGPRGVIFYAAGESHGMRNVGDAPALFVVFEFHGRHARVRQADDHHLPRRLWRLIRHPRKLRAALRHAMRSVGASMRRRLPTR
jgi:uncharacterized cupin superfamily protein